MSVIFSCIILIIGFIYVFKVIFNSTNSKSININTNINSLLNKVFEVQHFSDIRTTSYNDMKIINASTHGENYIFGIRNNKYFAYNDIETLHEISKKEHIHSVILVTTFKSYVPSSVLTKVNNYKFEIWDINKLNSLLDESNSTLKTSDTSDDTCDIDENADDPIKNTSEKKGLFDDLFKKPDRL